MVPDPITITIIVLAVGNIGVFIRARILINRLDKLVHPKSDRRMGTQASLLISDEDCTNLNKCSKKASFWYTFYANITAIFPLLGIFGTVVSLMGLAGTEGLAEHFSVALNTTKWGLIGAMAFKLLDSAISSPLERALDEADYLIHQHDEEKREKYAAPAKSEYYN